MQKSLLVVSAVCMFFSAGFSPLYAQEATAWNQGKNAALIWAATTGDVQEVQKLLKEPDVNVNATDETDWTPLMWAAEEGHIKVVRELLKQEDINVNAQNKMGDTALILAAVNGRVKVVKELLAWDKKNNPNQFDLDINVTDIYHNTALILAVYNNALNNTDFKNYVSIVQELVKRPDLDINVRNRFGSTALSLAKQALEDEKGFPAIIKAIENFEQTRTKLITAELKKHFNN